ncbi:MAG: hypothetical protein JWN44_4078 [Myxococcales bacterium]|nr:hypothetical protein [Myxococcales bacterium]
MTDVIDRFASRLAAGRRAARAELAAAGRLRRDLDDRPLEMPRGFALALAAAVDEEARIGSPRAEALERHYLELMPRLRAGQLDSSADPAARFFDARLEWSTLPRLAAAVARLGRAELLRRDLTLAALYSETAYGGFMPLLYAYPSDLASYDASALDRHFAAPLVHELAHGARHRPLLSLHFDECLAGYFGTRALDGDNDLFAAPWLSQVGQALARVAGVDRVRAAYRGEVAWEEALPAGLGAAIRERAWQDYLEHRPLHLLSDAARPGRWMKLCFLAAAGAPLDWDTPWRDVPAGEEAPLDEEILADALRAMCLRNFQVARSFRVESRVPPAPIVIDLDECRVSTAAGADGFDIAPPAYLFPPAVAARVRARGINGWVLELTSLAALDEARRALLDGARDARGDGFQLTLR